MKTETVAIIGGHGLGDNLVELVLAHNACIAGYRTTVFSNVIGGMSSWFPQYKIVPNLERDRPADELDGFTFILCPHKPWAGVSKEAVGHWVAYESMYLRRVTRVDNMSHVSGLVFELSEPSKENGICPPAGLRHRFFAHRVCIHPTSAENSKNWLPKKFLRLATRLENRGFEVVFIMSAAEREDWQAVLGNTFALQSFERLNDCASFLYESGYFIGNDSGCGHLASCLDIPTVSIHGRRGKSRLWRPGWGKVEVVTPSINVIGGDLRQHLWKYFLPVAAVERAFYRLVEGIGGGGIVAGRKNWFVCNDGH